MKRWLAGKGLTIDRLERMAQLCGLVLGDLAREAEECPGDLAHELTLAQERALSSNIFLSFLPLSHAYEHSGGQFFPISIAAQIYYAEGADTLVPVELNRDGFLAFIGAHDFKCLHAYSAYPDRRLFDIKDALGIE